MRWLVSLILLICVSCQAEIITYRSSQSAHRQKIGSEWTRWSDWESDNTLIRYDTEYGEITIMKSAPVSHMLKGSVFAESDIYYLYMSRCQDFLFHTRGKNGKMTLVTRPNDKKEVYITIDNKQTVYRVS